MRVAFDPALALSTCSKAAELAEWRDRLGRAGLFQRVPTVLTVVDHDAGNGNGPGHYRLLEDLTHKYNPYYME